jgi:tRNA/rRNA methyltransferase
MGVQRLLLAHCPEYEEGKVRMMAVHAWDLYEKAERFESLGEALADFSLSAGFSRRVGEKRKAVSLPLRTFAQSFVARTSASGISAPLALVFGNEKDGLTDEELGLCSLAIHIPSSKAFPSLNVAQAVQLACYEFFIAAAEARPHARNSGPSEPASESPARRRLVDAEVSAIIAALAERGFFRKSDDSHIRSFLRELCERSGAVPAEVDYLKKLFLKAAALAPKDRTERT